MKILFYTPVKLTSGGGCERWHCDVTNSLKKQFKVDVEIVSSNLGDERWNEKYLSSQLQGIPYQKLDFPIFFGVLIPTPRIFLFLLKKFRAVDAVHFIHGFAGQDILIALLKFLTGKKVAVGHHAPIFHGIKSHNLYMKLIARHVLKLFDYHQTLNAQDKDFLEKKWGIKNVYFIPSGVRVEKFLTMRKKPHGKLVFISVGRYEKQKGLDLLFQAIEKFNQKFPKNNAEFRFIGQGSLTKMIDQYAKKNTNIVNLGFIPYEAMPKIYSNCDLYLLPSREEPFGLVLVEAWASGLPALATKTEGPNDMLIEGKNGWFIEEVSVDGIYTSISSVYKKFLKDKNFLNQFEAESRATGRKFSIDKTAKSMMETFFTI